MRTAASVPPKKVGKILLTLLTQRNKIMYNMIWQKPKEKTMVKRNWMGILVVMLAMGVVLAGCPNDTTTTDEFNLDELLRKYMGPNPQTWGDNDNREEVAVYYLDHSRFDAFKAELDAGGEYVQDDDDENEFTRDWDTGKEFARLGKKPDDRVQLTLAKADNSTLEYHYTKNPQASGDKLDELLRKYMGPNPQTWGDDDNREEVAVYYLDHSRFDAFKAELDAGGKYIEYETQTRKRDWDTGKTFVRLGVKLNGKKLELDRCNADNSTSEYKYIKIP
jgi:hypothetical protein